MKYLPLLISLELVLLGIRFQQWSPVQEDSFGAVQVYQLGYDSFNKGDVIYE